MTKVVFGLQELEYFRDQVSPQSTFGGFSPAQAPGFFVPNFIFEPLLLLRKINILLISSSMN